MDQRTPESQCLRGLVTDADLAMAEVEFPGISQFHAGRIGKDHTFLELLAAYLGIDHTATAH
jgi:hypothetical protein